MYTGWTRAFKINRRLLPQEYDSALPREIQHGVEPDEHMGVIRFNSTYVDWIDRCFLYRGAINTVVISLICAVLTPMIFCQLVWQPLLTINEKESYWWVGVLLSIPSFLMVGYLFYFGLRKEYLAYRYWPIRFNRKTRMVHVFRHNGRNGVLSVPWDQVFFHIGQGTDQHNLRDIRGEVMDGDMIVDTFALGHAVSQERPLREMWEFIRRYMDEGPLEAAPHPLERYVGLSVRPTLKNCFLSMGSYYAGDLAWLGLVLMSPFIAVCTLTRWIVFHTCKSPVFPPEIEATCKVDPDDPNVWPIPDSSAQFAADIPGLLEHAEARAKRQREAELGLNRPEILQKPKLRAVKHPVSRRVRRWTKK